MFFDRVKSNFPRITTLKCKMQNKRVARTHGIDIFANEYYFKTIKMALILS